MIKRIESIKNAQIKKVMMLKTPAKARQEGLFILEGSRAVLELCAPWKAESLWISDSFVKKNPEYIKELKDKHPSPWKETELYQVPDGVFDKMAETMNPQGVLAVVQRYGYTTGHLQKERGLWIVLENLQDPGNAGTILRTADACGASGILCTKGTVDFYNSKVVRSAMGSLFHTPFVVLDSMEEAAAFLKKQKASIIGTHLRTDSMHYDVDYTGNTAIVIGNEGAGMSDQAASLCTQLVKIPMPGRAESLNASVAAAVMMYEVLRQRMA